MQIGRLKAWRRLIIFPRFWRLGPRVRRAARWSPSCTQTVGRCGRELLAANDLSAWGQKRSLPMCLTGHSRNAPPSNEDIARVAVSLLMAPEMSWRQLSPDRPPAHLGLRDGSRHPEGAEKFGLGDHCRQPYSIYPRKIGAAEQALVSDLNLLIVESRHFAFSNSARRRSSCCRSSGVNASPKSSASKIGRISISSF